MGNIKENIAMLAHKYNGSNINLPVYVQPKVDGIRAIWRHKEKVFRTRNNLIIEGAPTLTKLLGQYNLDIDIDGEMTIPGETFNKMSGVVRRKSANVVLAEMCLTYTIFDVIDNKPFYDRLKYIKDILSKAMSHPSIIYLETHMITSEIEIERYHLQFNEKGYEGSIYRTTFGLYEIKRSKNLLKRKDFREAEGEIIALNEGTGKYTNMLGSFSVELDVLGDSIIFEVGSGLDDAQRQAFWDMDPEGIIRKRIKFKYQELSENSIPRFPIFLEVM